MIDRETRQNGVGWSEGSSYTLDTQDRHAVCFAFANSGKAGLSDDENTSPTIKAARNGENAVCYSVDCRNLYLNKEKSGTLQSKNQGGHSLNYQNPVLIVNSSGDGIATTLDSHYFKGCGEREGIEREYVAYERIPNENRGIVCEQPSRELHRAGCVQRYASGVQEER